MAVEFLMPKLGLTMESGTIIEWLVPAGSSVEAGSPVLSIETDKVESEVEASASGLLHPLGGKGDNFACGEIIGWFLDDGEAPPAMPVAAATTVAPASAGDLATTVASAPRLVGQPQGVDGRLFVSPNARRIAADRGVDLATIVGSGPGGRVVSEDLEGAPVAHATVVSTIAARQLSDLLGVDLRTVRPSGADPRIDKNDVARHVRALLAAATAGSEVPPTPPATVLAAPSQPPTDVIAMRGMRGTIASRMHGALQEMAQLTLTMDATMDAVIADRSERKVEGRPPSYTDYVIVAVAQALRDHPVVNSQITGEGVALLPGIHVGMAVALDEGLVVPVVHDADSLPIETVAEHTSRLADAARAGGLTLPELEGGTFSVTTLGMFGVDVFTPVINPPNTGILGVGRLRDEVRWEGSTAVKTTVMTLSFTWDHRAFDGAPAAEFVAAVRDRLTEWGSDS